jgi:hypothetical protein
MKRRTRLTAKAGLFDRGSRVAVGMAAAGQMRRDASDSALKAGVARSPGNHVLVETQLAAGAHGGGRFCWACRRGWDEAAAGRFVGAALTAFPGSVEVDKNGEPLPLEQLEFDLGSDPSPGNTPTAIERSKRMAATKTKRTGERQ